MAVQSEIFSTEYGVRSFISTKHIATKQHMAVWLQRKEDSIWVQLSTSNYELINNSAVLTSAPNSTIYSQVEIRVADTPDELGSSQSEIAVLAGLYDEIVALYEISSDITTVASNTTNVTTVSNNIVNINSVATNIVPNLTEILQADTNATIATTKAAEASASATSASNSATTATNQATIATTKASEASASATSASTSANTATTKANEASASATSASNSATSASNSATTATNKANDASTSASLASVSANNASTSETMAYKWSSNPVDTIVETDKYSAFHWATKAQQYASSVDPSNLVHKTGDTMSGNLNFASGTKITGDFNNAVNANRTAFQSTNTGSTQISVIPNNTTAGAAMHWYYGSSDIANTSRLRVGITSTNEAWINSDVTGTGIYAPIVMHSGGAERMRIDTAGNVGIGTVNTGLQSEQLHIANSTAPKFMLTNTIGYSWSILVPTNNGELKFKYEQSSITPLTIDRNGNVLFNNGTFGYGTGAGGTVTQLTSKGTSVTLNKPTGEIITSNEALVSGGEAFFVVNNSLVTTRDGVTVNPSSTNKYTTVCQGVFNGGFYVRIKNVTGGSLSEAFSINYSVIKGANA